MSGTLETALLIKIFLKTSAIGELLGLSVGTDDIIQQLISFFLAACIWIGILWVITLAMHMVFEHRRRDEFKRLAALRKRFPNHGLRPRL